MIYLIDDKKERQEKDYNWTADKLKKYENVLVAIYSLEEIEQQGISKEIFNEGNIILLHESFFENGSNKHHKDSIEIRKNLNDYVQNQNSWVVYFSGSKSSRTNSGKIAHVPVSILYQNLKCFLEKVKKGDINLNYILFGKDPEIENDLIGKLEIANDNFDDSIIETYTTNFIFQTEGKQNVPVKLKNAIKESLSTKDDYEIQITDAFLNEVISKFLEETKYDNIFIPLCFGSTLSDFNGLRLASMIRCTKSKNQLSNIFIYGFVGLDYIFENEYFNILKTKNIHLIDYKKAGFKSAIEKECEPLLLEELSSEICKLKLDVPNNYEDSHSIANEWAIYRWSKTIGASDSDIKKIEEKVNNNIYFKYLQSIYPVSVSRIIQHDALKIKNLNDKKILYVDDEAEKGWYEILCTIIADVNEVNENFDYLGDELKGNSRDEILELIVNKVKDIDCDIIILDFRLHCDDFSEKNNQNITGVKVLKAIKEINPGIQVIVFSATNKVWNLQTIQEAGADAFIVKESPENSVDSDFTTDVIRSFRNELHSVNKRVFLKGIFDSLSKISSNLLNTDSTDETRFDEFLKLISKQIGIIKSSLLRFDLQDKSTIDIVFLNCFNFLENFKNEYYLNYKGIDYSFYIGIKESDVKRYKYNASFEICDDGRFSPKNKFDKPSFFSSLTAIMVDYFELFNYNDALIKKLARITEKRNNFIHGKKEHFDEKELLMIIEIMEKITSSMIE